MYRKVRDVAKIADLIQREAQFWQYVLDDIPPMAVNPAAEHWVVCNRLIVGMRSIVVTILI